MLSRTVHLCPPAAFAAVHGRGLHSSHLVIQAYCGKGSENFRVEGRHVNLESRMREHLPAFDRVSGLPQVSATCQAGTSHR